MLRATPLGLDAAVQLAQRAALARRYGRRPPAVGAGARRGRGFPLSPGGDRSLCAADRQALAATGHRGFAAAVGQIRHLRPTGAARDGAGPRAGGGRSFPGTPAVPGYRRRSPAQCRDGQQPGPRRRRHGDRRADYQRRRRGGGAARPAGGRAAVESVPARGAAGAGRYGLPRLVDPAPAGRSRWPATRSRNAA